MRKDALTQQDIDRLDWLLNEQGDRTAFYLHYYELTGNEQVLAMAKISQLTDFEGAVAERANEVVQQQYPNQYPEGGVIQFSHEVAPHLYEAITKDFNDGNGTGVLTDRAVLESARDAWDARGLGEQFPGNPLLAVERAADLDFKAAWDVFDSNGTEIAAGATLYTAIPDISGNPHPEIQERLENATYHLTEDGKAGFYTDRETGMTVGVFDRPADLTTEPLVQSQGVLSVHPYEVPPSEPPPPPPPDYRDAFTQYLADPPEGVNPITLATVNAMNGFMVDNNVPMTQQHYDAATASLTRGDSVREFIAAENEHVLASTGSGVVYNAGYALHSLVGLGRDNEVEAPAAVPLTPPVAAKEEPAFFEQPAHHYLFDARPEDPWAAASPFAADVTAGLVAPVPDPPPPQAPEAVPSYELQLPNGLLDNDFGTGGTTQPSYDDRSALPDVVQAPQAAIAPPAEPAPEPQTGGFFSGIQDYVNSFAFSPSQAQVADIVSLPPPVTHDPVPAPEPAQPSLFEQVSSFFSSPPPTPETAPTVYESVSPPPESHHESGFSVGSLFGGGNSHAESSPPPEHSPSYQASYSTESSYSNHDAGSHDEGGGHGADGGGGSGGGDGGGGGGGDGGGGD